MLTMTTRSTAEATRRGAGARNVIAAITQQSLAAIVGIDTFVTVRERATCEASAVHESCEHQRRVITLRGVQRVRPGMKIFP